MAKFIKTIVDRINLANRKGLCPFYTPDQICTEVHAESLNLWKKFIKLYEKDEEISLYFRPFFEAEDVDVSSGSGVYLKTKNYISNVVNVANFKKVTVYNIDKFFNAVDDSVRVPDAENPIGSIRVEGQIFVSPPFSTARIYSIKKPTKPVYAFSNDGEDYIYDDASSVDFEWDEALHDEILNRVLRNLGIADQRHDIVNYSQQEQTIEGK